MLNSSSICSPRSISRRAHPFFTDKNNKKAAKGAADALMELINEQNNNPRAVRHQGNFADFINGRWASFQANRDLQLSTLSSYQSMIKELARRSQASYSEYCFPSQKCLRRPAG